MSKIEANIFGKEGWTPKRLCSLKGKTYLITGANTGASTGTLSYRVGNGRIGLVMNESTTDTVDRYTVDSGNPKFTSAGGLFMPTVGDQITFVTPEYILGQGNSFPIMEAVMAGGTIANYDIAAAVDKNDGAGYSDFYNLYYPRAGSAGTVGNYTYTVTDASGILAGDYVRGTNVGLNAKVTNVDTGTNTITVDTPNLGTVTGVTRYSYLPTFSGLTPDTGIKMKWRIKTSTANSSAITSLYINAESTTTGRAYQYVLDSVDAELILTDLQSNSEVRIYNTGTTTELGGVEDSSTSLTYSYTWVGTDIPVDIVIHHRDYQYLRYENISLGQDGLTLPIQQTFDRNYLNA